MTFASYYQYIEVGRRKEKISFTSSAPVVDNYNIDYLPKYGNNPQVDIYIINSDNSESRYPAEHTFIKDGQGNITSITFGQLPETITGYILIQ